MFIFHSRVSDCAAPRAFLLVLTSYGSQITSLVPLATIVLGFSFIFGNSAATLFGSLVFIFATHVWDVGDLVLIDDQVTMAFEGDETVLPFSRLQSWMAD